jgi:hypothetical protein
MAEFFLLGPQILDITMMGWDFERLADDPHAIALKAFDFVGIVRQEPYLTDAEVAQNLRADPVVAKILFKTEPKVGLNRIEALILKSVGSDFIAQTDSASFLMQINDHAGIGIHDAAHGFRQLFATVASTRAEHVAGQAFGVEPYERRTATADITMDQGEVFAPIDDIAKDNRLEFSGGDGEGAFADTLDQ